MGVRKMKKNLIATCSALVLALISATASADSVIQIWECELNDGKTGADLQAASSAWLKVAKGMDGGADLKVYHEYRIAADVGDNGFTFILVAPDLKTWATWYDGEDPDGEMEEANAAWEEVAACANASLWSSEEVE